MNRGQRSGPIPSPKRENQLNPPDETIFTDPSPASQIRKLSTNQGKSFFWTENFPIISE